MRRLNMVQTAQTPVQPQPRGRKRNRERLVISEAHADLPLLEQFARLPMKWDGTWDLTTIPLNVLFAFWNAHWGQYGGRPREMRKCRYCSQEFGARAMRAHLPRCEMRPRVRQAGIATKKKTLPA
jgi:hypothetical protein